jgi:hypothetical protein
MMASAEGLSGGVSREFIPGILARPVNGVDERVIAAALFCFLGIRRGIGGTELRLSGIQTAITAQYAYRVAAPRAVKRFEQARKKSLALPARPGLAFNGVSAHR